MVSSFWKKARCNSPNFTTASFPKSCAPVPTNCLGINDFYCLIFTRIIIAEETLIRYATGFRAKTWKTVSSPGRKNYSTSCKPSICSYLDSLLSANVSPCCGRRKRKRTITFGNDQLILIVFLYTYLGWLRKAWYTATMTPTRSENGRTKGFQEKSTQHWRTSIFSMMSCSTNTPLLCQTISFSISTSCKICCNKSKVKRIQLEASMLVLTHCEKKSVFRKQPKD